MSTGAPSPGARAPTLATSVLAGGGAVVALSIFRLLVGAPMPIEVEFRYSAQVTRQLVLSCVDDLDAMVRAQNRGIGSAEQPGLTAALFQSCRCIIGSVEQSGAVPPPDEAEDFAEIYAAHLGSDDGVELIRGCMQSALTDPAESGP